MEFFYVLSHDFVTYTEISAYYLSQHLYWICKSTRNMTMMLKAALGLAAGATLFLGYCYYFDAKRRKDPYYKQKVRESKFFIIA